MTNGRILQLTLVALALIAAAMLAVSTGLYFLIPIVLVAGVGSFFVTDTLEWLSIEGWVANLASVAILSFAVMEFYPADSAGKLMAIAKLLVYLQAVLFFQMKTPRLNWQIMVLSLLQVVITTIFSIEFEGGVLFLLFFLVAGIALVLQNGFVGEHAIEQRNESSEEARNLIEEGESPESRLAWWKNDTKPQPTVTSLEAIRKFRIAPLAILPGVVLLASLFTFVVFLTAPRNVDPWFSPITYQVSSTGISQQVELEETGRVDSSSRRIFEAQFHPVGSSSDDPIQLNELPYFRGIALSNLTYKDGKTQWNAPYERIYANTYQAIQPVRRGKGARFATLDVTMEKTREPLLYTVMPTGVSENTLRSQLKFCHEISAFTRCRENEDIDFSPYKYELMVSLSQTNTPGRAWPYIANTINTPFRPMSQDPAQERWLTRMDRKVYPTLVAIADRIAKKNRESGGGRADLVRALENHFLDPENYSYTLDYNQVQRDLKIDPNEDFVANFKSGHCVAFASAMTLMLRSQGIPARLVVGFHGGDYSTLHKSYVVRGNDAHAWVEVYLTEEDCAQGNLAAWEYSPCGAWLRADPTPPRPDTDDGIGTEGAIELARSVWQDYVLGMESKKGTTENASLTSAIVEFLGDFNMERLSSRLETSRNRGWLAILQPMFFVSLLVAGIIGLLRMLILKAGYEEELPETTVGKIRRFFADAIGLISSDLREWVIGQDSETAFYTRLTDILESHELVRESTQTHREFASEVASEYREHPSSSLISRVTTEVTEAFNRVRFGRQELSPDELRGLDSQLGEIEQALKLARKDWQKV